LTSAIDNTSAFSNAVQAPAAPAPAPGVTQSQLGEVALDAFLVADGLATGNFFFVSFGLTDYNNLLGSVPGPVQAQLQQAFGSDFFFDYLLLSSV
jgi:hypothetical protein